MTSRLLYHVQHTRFARSVDELRAMGTRVLYGEGGFVPNAPGETRPYPWATALDAIDALQVPRA